MAQQLIIRAKYESRNPGQHLDTVSSGSYEIKILHPGYQQEHALLLKLPGPDHPDGGLHHETARIACAILAGNRWDGFLSESRIAYRIAVEPDGILRKSVYFFHLPTSTVDTASQQELNPYPVVPCFDQWVFPHHNLPKIWQDLELPGANVADDDEYIPLGRNSSCRITNETEICEYAHLCPKSQEDWFNRNGMADYQALPSRGVLGVDHISNICRLRPDLHTVFDRKHFVFVPKRDVNNSVCLVFHLLRQSKLYASLYQNIQLQDMHVSKEALFARFAWSVFNNGISLFLSKGVPRALLIGTNQSQWTSAEDCSRLIAARKSQSRSPKKRSMPAEVYDEPDRWPESETRRMRQKDSGYDSTPEMSDTEDKLHVEDELIRMEELSRGRSLIRDGFF